MSDRRLSFKREKKHHTHTHTHTHAYIYIYIYICVYREVQFKSDSSTLKPDRLQHDRPSTSVILLTYLIIYLLTPWLYDPLRALASWITDAHSSLSTAFCHHLLNFISRRSFSTSSSHLNLCLPLLPLLSGLLPNIFLTVLPWTTFTTCPIHSKLFFLIPAIMSRSLNSSLNSWSALILHMPCSTAGPSNLLNIIPFYVPSLFRSISATAHVSLPHTAAGLASFYIP